MEGRERSHKPHTAEQDRHRAAQLRGRARRTRGRLRQSGGDTLLESAAERD